MQSFFMIMFLITGMQNVVQGTSQEGQGAPQEGVDQQKFFLLLEAENFSKLALAFDESPSEKKAESAANLIQYLYKYSHVIYAESLYKAMKKRNLPVDQKVETQLSDRLAYLKSRVEGFHEEVKKEYHPKKFCGQCAVSFYLGYRTPTLEKLEAENLKRPEDLEVEGLLGLFKGMIELEKSALMTLEEKLKKELVKGERKKIYFQMFYLQIYREHDALSRLTNEVGQEGQGISMLFLESLNVFDKLLKQKESSYVL